MISMPTASYNTISRRFILSLRKQLRLCHSEANNVEWWPLVTCGWNCIGGVSIDNAKIFAQDWLKATRSKFNVKRMDLNSELLGVAGWKHTTQSTPLVLSAKKKYKKVLILYFFLEKIWISWSLGYMHMFFCQFWFLANLGLDHIFCKHPANEGFRKFFCNLSHAKDFVLYN
jgi:hypothetical protein